MSLSQQQYGELRSLYASVYTPRSKVLEEELISEEMLDLTDEEIVDQVEEFFNECVEEGLDIDLIENIICEHIDSLEVLSERVDPKETQRRRDQAKDRLSTGNSMKAAAAKSGSGDEDSRSSKLSKIKSAVKTAAKGAKAAAKTVGKAAQGGVGLAARAVGTAQRAGSAVKGAAKSGYDRGKGGGGSSSSSGSSDSGETGASSSSGSSSSSKGGGGSSAAPVKRKDGLVKRGLKKLIRGVGKTVSATASAVKAGADSITDRARKEELEASGLFSSKEIEAIMESGITEDASYDRNRKRAAQRAADRNAARAAGKTGAVPGVGYVTPRKERETYTDSSGTERHKSGAKMP
jgi:hypothetical protein